MNGAFPLLDDRHYEAYVGPLTHRGSNPSTHLATIKYPVQSASIVSVVKLVSPSGLGACNEAMAWLLLRAAGVPAPRNAAILRLSEAKAVRALGRKAVPASMVHDGYVLAWAAMKLEFQSIQALFAGTKGDERWIAFLRTVQGAAVAAFDEIILNADRNTGNVLYQSRDSCVPIDHELCFGTQDWRVADLRHLSADGDSLHALRRACKSGQLSTKAFQETLNRMAWHAEKHERALDASRAHIAYLLQQVFPESCDVITDRVLSFVAERTAQQWMNERLGVL